jgi:hypothetical protein
MGTRANLPSPTSSARTIRGASIAAPAPRRAGATAAARVLVLLAAGLAAASFSTGCGDRRPAAPVVPAGPLAPTAAGELKIEPGWYWLEVIGFALVSGWSPSCDVTALTPGGTLVTTLVVLERAGGEWVATSPPRNGSLVLRFGPRGAPGPSGVPLAGTARGWGDDVSTPVRPASENRLIIGGARTVEAADLDGVGSTATSYLSGTLTGAIGFSDRIGVTATCPAARWSLQPFAGNALGPAR